VGERLTRLAGIDAGPKPAKHAVLEALMDFKDSEDGIMRNLVPNLGLNREHELLRHMWIFIFSYPVKALPLGVASGQP
jgi:hypothetical protein